MQALLLNIAKSNSDPELNGFFVDPRNKVALAGHRRIAGVGDALVRVRDAEIDMNGLPHDGGFFDFATNDFFAIPGLPGKELAEKQRDLIDAEKAEMLFNDAFAKVNGSFMVLVNPRAICDFIEERKPNGDFSSHKINMQVFDGISALGQFPGQARVDDSGRMTIALRKGREIVPAYIDEKNTILPTHALRDGNYYIVKPVATVEGIHYVQVLREFKRGVRLAIQYFRSGLLMPGSPRYSVLEEKDNGISHHDIIDLPFVEDQVKIGTFAKAPYMHFDLDVFYYVMKTLEMYDTVEVRFKDAATPVLVTGVPMEGQPLIDAIVGSTSPYRGGKVCTQ